MSSFASSIDAEGILKRPFAFPCESLMIGTHSFLISSEIEIQECYQIAFAIENLVGLLGGGGYLGSEF